jgi:ABC-2 type transport system ATP-binding protein
MSYAIEAEGLEKTYPPATKALDGLGFAVPEGTVFGLLGPNGAGKSTTVKMLTTLARPDAGSARVAGIDVLADQKRVRGAIGVVGQKTGTTKELTARENLELQGQFHGMRGRKLRPRVEELLERFGLNEAADRAVKTYSGGMVRRLDVAIGLIQQPSVLFLDEPTTGLDPEARSAMWEEIRRLRSEASLTILLTTHYLEEADQLADRLAIIDRGKVVAEGSPDELKAELQGDTVHVELATPQPNGRAHHALESLGQIRELRVAERELHARVEDGAAALPAILAALGQVGLEVATATIARPSLDEVYLRYAGRSFAEAEREREPDSTDEGGTR